MVYNIACFFSQMYDHILQIEREVFWEFGDVTCAGYPLDVIDTISPEGNINKNSVLALIVYGVSVNTVNE